MYYIYALLDPINRTPFYVGKGKNRRAWQHLKFNKNDNNYLKKKYITNIRLLGHEPEIHFIMENIEDEDFAYSLEYSMIKNAHLFGIKLTNRIGVDLRPPCRKGSKMSDEAKKKIGESVKNRPPKKMSESQKNKISLALKNKPKPIRSEDHKKNIGLSKSKLFEVIFPDGHKEEILNMRKFCKEHGLSQGHLHNTTTGKRKHHKGFSAISKI